MYHTLITSFNLTFYYAPLLTLVLMCDSWAITSVFAGTEISRTTAFAIYVAFVYTVYLVGDINSMIGISEDFNENVAKALAARRNQILQDRRVTPDEALKEELGRIAGEVDEAIEHHVSDPVYLKCFGVALTKQLLHGVVKLILAASSSIIVKVAMAR